MRYATETGAVLVAGEEADTVAPGEDKPDTGDGSGPGRDAAPGSPASAPSGPPRPTDPLEGRRSALGERLDAMARAERAVAEQEARLDKPGWSTAVRLGSEFVSAVIVGFLIGFGLDWALGTRPWLMVVFLLLGFAAGVLNVLRSAGLISAANPGNRPPRQGD